MDRPVASDAADDAVVVRYIAAPSWKDSGGTTATWLQSCSPEITDVEQVRRLLWSRYHDRQHWLIVVTGATVVHMLYQLAQWGVAVAAAPIDAPIECFDLVDVVASFVIVVPKTAVPAAVMEPIVSAAQKTPTSFDGRDVVTLYAGDMDVGVILDALSAWMDHGKTH